MTSQSDNRTKRSPIVAFFLALIPGVGQIYAGKIGRGLAVLLLIPTLIALTIWRMSAGGINYSGPATQAPSPDRVNAAWGMASVLFVLIFLIYLWSIWDASRAVRGRPLPAARTVLFACIATFIIGWDVVQINLPKVFTDFPKMAPYLRDIIWPWDSAFVQGVEQTQDFKLIGVPCTDNPIQQPESISGSPTISVSPTCGEMAGPVQPDGTRNPPGTVLHITGQNFRPNEAVIVWWEPPDSNEFRPRSGGESATVTDSTGSFSLDMNIPVFTVANAVTRSTSKLIVRQEQKSGALRPSENLMLALSKMAETIFVGLMATFFGIILAFPLSFLAAKNLMAGNTITRLIYTFVRMMFNIIRSIEPLIWAVIFIAWVGLGPLAGTLALAFHTVASLGKLYSEAIESIEDGPLEAIRATGANWLQVIVYGVIPQIVPPFVSFTVYRWDINIRASTIIGFVGGGGIGFLLLQWINRTDYKSAGIAVWLIGIIVSILDYASARIREEFV
jgi:phosphonate transport system permease protein